MKSPLAIASLAALGLLLNTASAADSPRVNGWFPCTYSTYQGAPVNATSPKEFECSELEVPLCYDGVCTSDRKINLFVKRRVGKTESKDPKAPRKAGILIQGGPGGASPVMENVMMNLVDPENDTVDYYTFDHRGTGRSEYLECDAAGALTPGSPDGTQPGNEELPNCIADLKFQYDGQAAAFSTTSAAMDVRMLIDTFLANHDVYPYGMSYGTYLAQRILQLKVPQVKGYIFDGVDALTTKTDPIESSNSHWNQAMKGPSRRYLEFCFDDQKCPLKDKITSREKALEDILALVDKLDTAPNECAKAAVTESGNPDLKPSEAVRQMMYGYATDLSKRAQGLEILASILRCNADDVKQAGEGESEGESEGEGGDAAAAPTPGPLDTLDDSKLLFDVVVFGERWAQPPPTREERTKFAHEGLINAGDVERNAAAYCLYTGSTDPACAELNDTLPESKETFAYKRDKYFDEPLTLPTGVSAIVMNGGLDFQTPAEFGELLYSKLKGSGDGVMMVNFDYGTHCAGEGVETATGSPCHDSIIRQFIMKGDVAAVDVGCMEKLPVQAFHAGDAAAKGDDKPTQEEGTETQDEGSEAQEEGSDAGEVA